MFSSKKKILIGITGSIAAYKVLNLISRWQKEGHEIRVVMTPESSRFIGAASIEGLTGNTPLVETFKDGHMMSHIYWARWADMFLIAPASAHTINKMASGIADNLLLNLFLAYEKSKPLVLAPAMNTQMFQHPATQNSLKTLKTWGVYVLDAPSGPLACGEIGEGKLLEPDQIYQWMQEQIFHQPPVSNASAKKILVTGGGTQEPIDSVRVITNTSTGKTAASICEALYLHGHDVTYLHSPQSVLPTSPVKSETFTTFQSLNDKLQDLLKKHSFDFIIHSAAVSDYSVRSIEEEGRQLSTPSSKKISSKEEITLHLKKNFKIVHKLKDYANNPIQVVAFKLTHTSDLNEQHHAVKRLFYSRPTSVKNSTVDYVLHNDLDQIRSKEMEHGFQIYKPYLEKEDIVSIEKGTRLSQLTTALNSLILGELT